MNRIDPRNGLALPLPQTRSTGVRLPQYDPKKTSDKLYSMPTGIKDGLRLVEIFDSVQGEGTNVGEPMTFVRFARCNLACDFCDTPYNTVNITLSEEALLDNLLARNPRWVNFTGGEPMLQLPVTLVLKLREAGIRVTCETNGMVFNPALLHLSHVTISPKKVYDVPDNPIPFEKIIAREIVEGVLEGAITLHELRYVICGATDDLFALPEDLQRYAHRIYLSPVFMEKNPVPSFTSGKGHNTWDEEVDPDSLRRCFFLLNKYKAYPVGLSIQVHKLLFAR